MGHRVVITGAGTINPLGNDVAQTMIAMQEGRCGIGPLDIRDVDRLSIQIGGQVKAYDEQRISIASKSRFMTALLSLRYWPPARRWPSQGLRSTANWPTSRGSFWARLVAG